MSADPPPIPAPYDGRRTPVLPRPAGATREQAIADGVRLAEELAGHDADAAIRIYEQVRAMREAEYGADHPATLEASRVLGGLLLASGRHVDARGCLAAALPGLMRHFGPRDPVTMLAAYDLAECLAAVGDTARAWRMHDSVWQARQQVLGAHHPETEQSRERAAALAPR